MLDCFYHVATDLSHKLQDLHHFMFDIHVLRQQSRLFFTAAFLCRCYC